MVAFNLMHGIEVPPRELVLAHEHLRAKKQSIAAQNACNRGLPMQLATACRVSPVIKQKELFLQLSSAVTAPRLGHVQVNEISKAVIPSQQLPSNQRRLPTRRI